MIKFIPFLFLSYIIGGIPTGYLAVKITQKKDIRNCGSGNIGFTNVLRTAGPVLGSLVMVIDTGKAFFTAYCFSNLFETPSLYRLIFGITVIIGNIFNPFLKFKGGKGVAAGLGVALAISPVPVIFSVAAFSITILISRYISLGSLTAASVFLISNILYHSYAGKNWWAVIFSGLLFIVIVFSHTSNIKRLLRGEENKIGKRKQ